MRPPTATELGPQLQAIGLDPKNLPPLSKLAPEQLRKVMPLFAKSLGVKCTACHVFENPEKTPRMKVAAQMWEHFARTLAISTGEPIFCDSCHHGSLAVLDRTDKTALATWMKDNFVTPLARVDGKDHGCATCHGEPLRPRFIDLWKTGR
jgi:hypothetical protein